MHLIFTLLFVPLPKMFDKIRYRTVFAKNGFNKRCEGLVQIECLLHGKRIYFSTHIYLKENQWRNGIVVNHALASEYNAMLVQFVIDIERKEIEIWVQGRTPTLEVLRSAVRDNVSVSVPLSDFSESVINNSERSEHTKDCYRTTIKAVSQFDKNTTLKSIDYDYLCRFQRYLKDKGLAHNTVVGRLRNVRTLINEAVKRKLLTIDENPFIQFKIPSMTPRRLFCAQKEIKRLESATLSGRESHLRDCFLFACCTGLRYSDIVTLNKEHLKDGWIHKKMVKTNIDVDIPYKKLFKGKACEILERYDDVSELCNIGCNATSNKQLKALTNRIIGKKCTWHVARHTFAVNLLINGVPITTVQRLLGHKKLEDTQIYAEVVRDTVEKDVKKAFKK